jgi:hypothetical protein
VQGRDLGVGFQELRVVGRLEEVGAEHRRVGTGDVEHGGVAVVASGHADLPARKLRHHFLHRGHDLGVPHPALGASELAAEEPVDDGGGDAAAAELAEQRAEPQRPLEGIQQRLLLEGRRLAGHLDAGLLHPVLEEELLHLALAHEVPLRLALLDLEQRRLRDEEMARLDHLHHVAEEEREQEGPDVRAVHVGVGHQDDLVIAQLADVELLRADAGAQRGDEQPDFIVGQDLVVARLSRVDDLAAQREHRLRLPVASLLGGAAGGIALHEEDLAELGIALRAIRELGREPFVVAAALAGEVARLASRLARLRRAHRLVGDLSRGGRVLLERLAETVVDDLLDQPLHFGVPELALGLPLELGIGDADGDHRGEPLAHVVARHVALEALEEAVGLRVVADGAGEGGAEAGEMRAALARVDVVGEGKDALLIAVVVLQRDLDLDTVPLALEEEHLGVDRRLVLVEVLDELDDAALVEEGVAALVPLVLDDDLEALVEEGHLAEPVGERVEGERGLLEDLAVRLELHDGAVLGGLLAGGELAQRHAVLVALGPHLAVAADLQLEPLAERVDHRHPHAVEAAGYLVGGVLELAAGMEHGEDDFRRRLATFLVGVHGNAAAVVPHRAGPVGVQDDLDAVAVARQRLVNGVVHDLVDEVVEPIGPGVADVHGRPLAHGLEALEDLDVARGIGVGAHAAPDTARGPGSRTLPSRTDHHAAWRAGTPSSAVVRNTCPAPSMWRSTLA